MAKIRPPRYFRARRLASNETGYFWERPSWAKPPAEKFGRLCPVTSEALGTDLASAIAKADLLNMQLDEWRTGVEGKAAEGTVKALFSWYRTLDRYKKGVGERAKRDYRSYMAKLEVFQLKTTTLGQRRASEITAGHADQLYAAISAQRGKRAGAYCMQICRRVWNEAIRHGKLKAPNPFAKMGIKMIAEKGNRATSRAEYDLFRQTAREMGFQSMATAAAISFELLRRVTDVFGYEFEEDADDRGFFWEDYEPGVRFAMRQGKTGDRQVIPLCGEDGERLYPDLEDELARMTKRTGHIVINETTGKRYDESRAHRRFRAIKKKAGLPAEMTLTGFRHGGATELGDAGVYDIRPVSGHRTLQQTATYNKATESKARSAGEARRAHIAKRKKPGPAE